jgi:predicted permease
MRADAAYDALLRCYPAAFREEYGSQMRFVFREQLGDARRSGGRGRQLAVWLRAAADTLIVAPREHGHVIAQDLRYALRMMAAAPGFALVAIVSLALGIGANTAIFSLWNGMLRAPLPSVRAPEELVILTNPTESGSWTGRMDFRTDGYRPWLTYGEFEDLRQHADLFAALMAADSSLSKWEVRVDGGAREEARGRLVSDGFFEVLGAGATIGRVFTESDNCAASPCAVISYSYWQRRFGGSPDVLGKSIAVRRGTAAIVGVAPRGFVGETAGQQPDVWLPLHTAPFMLPGTDRLHDTPPNKVMWLHVFGRLKPSVTPAQAESQANAIFHAGLQSFYGAYAAGPERDDYLDQRLQLRTGTRGASASRAKLSDSLTALLAAVGVLLLIACANLANLLLARGAARRPEIALRVSLGASRRRIMRQLVTESLTLAAIGGAAAIAVAYGLHGALVAMLAESDSRFGISFALDPRVLGFVVLATLGATLLFGVLPAWHATRPDLGGVLKEETRGSIGALGRMRSGRALVSLQLALSLPLLVGAGLLARTVYNLQRADLGFPAERLLLSRVNFREAGYDDVRGGEMLRAVRDSLAGLPGVRAVSFSQLGIFSGGESSTTIDVEGYTPASTKDRGSARDVVGPGYFATLGVPITLGRDILDSDRADSLKVCVVNEAFARVFFASRNPIGLRVTAVEEGNVPVAYQVVGVAKDARTQGVRDAVKPRYYIAGLQHPSEMKLPTFQVRTTSDAIGLAAAVRQTIDRADALLPIMMVTSLERELIPLTAQDRTTASVAIVFSGIALALAAIGLYGVLSYGIARRTGEIAVRIALGAQRARVVTMILGETSLVVGAGLALGGALAYAATRLIGSRLYGVAAQDPLTLSGAIAALLLVAFGAAYLPARRAARLDPAIVLRAS